MGLRVVIADSLAKEAQPVFARYPELEIVDRAGLSRAELLRELPAYDGLIVRSRTTADAEVIAAGTKLKIIGRAGIGVDNVDLKAATRAGIVVMNTPEGNATTTAEHTISLIFAMARRIPQAHAALTQGRWEKNRFMGRELRGKTLGVIGLGNIGRIVAQRAQAMQLKVLGHDPFFDAEAAKKIGVESVTLEQLITRADIITVHTPLNDDTRGLISDGEIGKLKKGAMLVNCARGGIYDEAALLRGLESGQIGALALDVFEQEPPPADHPLLKHEAVVVTPHLGASTSEAQILVAIDIAEQMGEFAQGLPARNAVNLPRVAAQERAVLAPYVALAESMGSFLAQVMEGQVRRLEVRLAGDIAQHSLTPITSAAVAGVLQKAFDRPVNAVNSRVLAEERGIEVVESRATSAASTYASTLEVTATGASGTRRVAGTVFAGQGRFVELDGIPLEAVPDGTLLLISNRDRPGVIGHIGNVLGSAGINIARMHLGLDAKHGQALSLVSIDAPVPKAVLDRLRQGDVLTVVQVTL